MKAERIQQLNHELTTLTTIILKAQEAVNISKYLLEDEVDPETHYQKRMNTFFYYSRFVYWQVAVIELSKIYSDGKGDKFNIRKIIAKLQNDGEYGQLNISPIKISGWLEKIIEHEAAINNLKLQRDKLYAHEDGNNDIFNTVSLPAFEDLLKVAIDFVHFVDKELGNIYRGFDMVNPPVHSLKYAIEMLAHGQKKKIEPLIEVAKQYGLDEFGNDIPE